MANYEILYADNKIGREEEQKLPDFYLTLEDAKNDTKVPKIKYEDFIMLFPFMSSITNGASTKYVYSFVWDGYKAKETCHLGEAGGNKILYDALKKEWHHTKCYKTAKECEDDNQLVVIDFVDK